MINFIKDHWLWIFWVLSSIYCMWRMVKRYKKSSHDGVIGMTPGLDLIVIIIMGPILAIVDIAVTWVMMIITYYKNKKEEKQVL